MPELVSQRVVDAGVTEAVAQRLQLGRDHPLIGFGSGSRAPCPPSSSRGPNDGTGSTAGRCSTRASAFV